MSHGQQDLPESFGWRLLPGNEQGTIAGRFLNVVCWFGRLGTFSGPQMDLQPAPMNVNAVDHLGDCTVSRYGRILHPSFASEMLVERFDDDVLDISCGNAGHRSDFCRLGLSMQARERHIIAIAD